MLKSSEYRDRVVQALGKRAKEEKVKTYLERVDAWEADKTSPPPFGSPHQLRLFVRTVKLFGDDDDLIDEEEAKALAKLLPDECKHPTRIGKAATAMNPGLSWKGYLLLLLLLALVGYSSFLWGTSQAVVQTVEKRIENTEQLSNVKEELASVKEHLKSVEKLLLAEQEKTKAEAQSKLIALEAYTNMREAALEWQKADAATDQKKQTEHQQAANAWVAKAADAVKKLAGN